MTNLIFCAVGNPILFHDGYDRDAHWRYSLPERNYKTVVCNYNDFQPEENTYDIIYKDVGYKWQLVKNFLSNFDYSEFEYIGFFDDDIISDISNINRALEIAKNNNLLLFQPSMKQGSESSHSILLQNEALSYSITNFVEGMGCFIHVSLMPILQKFFEVHDARTGWGLDIILSPLMKTRGSVIHQSSIFHPPKDYKGYTPSYYDTSTAVEEMNYILSTVYPFLMKDIYGEDVGPYTQSHNRIYETIYKD